MFLSYFSLYICYEIHLINQVGWEGQLLVKITRSHPQKVGCADNWGLLWSWAPSRCSCWGWSQWMPIVNLLVFTPLIEKKTDIPVGESVTKCSNCDESMSATHQCSVTAPSPSLSQYQGVNVTFSDTGKTRKLNMMKFCDNCDSLYPLALGCQSCVAPFKPS